MTAGYFERIGAYGVLTVFSVLAIYPVLSILFLALHRKTDLVTGFAFPTRLDLSSFRAAWDEGRFGTLTKGSPVAASVWRKGRAAASLSGIRAAKSMSCVPVATARAPSSLSHAIWAIVPTMVSPAANAP